MVPDITFDSRFFGYTYILDVTLNPRRPPSLWRSRTSFLLSTTSRCPCRTCKKNGVDPEAASLAKLASISPPTSSGPLIAVDLDDVLSDTNQVIAECKDCLSIFDDFENYSFCTAMEKGITRLFRACDCMQCDADQFYS